MNADSQSGQGSCGPSSRSKGRRAVFKAVWFCVGLAFFGYCVYWVYPGLMHAVHEYRQDKRCTLRIPPDRKLQIIAGDPAAVKWLEERIEARAGSIPALLLLQSMTGETFGRIPHPFDMLGHHDGMGRDRYCSMNRSHVHDVRTELETFEAYKRGKQTFRFDRLQNIDLQDPESVLAGFHRGWEELDAGRIYILLHRESQRPDFYRHVMRHVTQLERHDGLSARAISATSPKGTQDWIQLYSKTEPNQTQGGNAIPHSILKNNKTNQYEILLRPLIDPRPPM